MESDDLTPRVPRKRSRSPSMHTATDGLVSSSQSAPTQRLPKRLRKSKDIPAYEASARAAQATLFANPLSRRALKRDAKKARRVAQRNLRARGGGMEVDDALEGVALLP
jgi:nuclear GTP-binding protein